MAKGKGPIIKILHHYDKSIRFFHLGHEIKMVEAARAVKKAPSEVTSKDLNETYRIKKPPMPRKGNLSQTAPPGGRHPTIR